MHNDFLLLDDGDGEAAPQRIDRLALGNTSGRDEAWLRDTLLAHPDLLPIQDLDSGYGPLIPLCRELRTNAGPIDAVFINPHVRLTLVECKLWRNPESRRKVVAQILDYAREISRWSYSDLQRQVAIATGKRGEGNVPYEMVRAAHPATLEQKFVDEAAASLRLGRFLLVIAGDGIREGLSAVTELINRNAALAFSFGLVEVALYGMPAGQILVQPRVLARTELLERTVAIVRDASGHLPLVVVDADETEIAETAGDVSNPLNESPRQAESRRWWQPVLDAPLSDPDQEPPQLYWPNNLRVKLPWQGAWISAYTIGRENGTTGVGTAGRTGADNELMRQLEPEMAEILAELPPGTQYRQSQIGSSMTIACQRSTAEFASVDEQRAWLIATIDRFVNVLRPRVRRLLADIR